MRLLIVIAAIGLSIRIDEAAPHPASKSIDPLRSEICLRFARYTKLYRAFQCYRRNDSSIGDSIQRCGSRLINFAEMVCEKFGGLYVEPLRRQEPWGGTTTDPSTAVTVPTSASTSHAICRHRKQSLVCECCKLGPCNIREILSYCNNPPSDAEKRIYQSDIMGLFS
ncbi:uncharacterized protein LOC111264658 [Varroa jacobsoni]|uniref:uncharacterized protein LOC111264658 n=1 Tax=Varroa jacobsoni TaxID=62625 RepID=UPI000BF6DC52|nr:uncharacterized protein LOC111264658 [Varroa jacobsoni]